MHIPAGWIIKHRRTAICDKNTQIRWQRRNVAIVNKCTEATFSLTGEDGAESAKGVEAIGKLDLEGAFAQRYFGITQK